MEWKNKSLLVVEYPHLRMRCTDGGLNEMPVRQSRELPVRGLHRARQPDDQLSIEDDAFFGRQVVLGPIARAAVEELIEGCFCQRHLRNDPVETRPIRRFLPSHRQTPGKSGCGCGVGGGGTPGALLLAIVLVIAPVRRRRARRV